MVVGADRGGAKCCGPFFAQSSHHALLRPGAFGTSALVFVGCALRW